jgi:hypothetical protein
MTYREMYTAVINGQITDEVITTAQNALAKLDERNAKRAATPKKVNEESVALMRQIAELMADGETRIAKVIGETIGISTQKASGLCGQMVKAGTLVTSEVKIPKVGKRVAYTLV